MLVPKFIKKRLSLIVCLVLGAVVLIAFFILYPRSTAGPKKPARTFHNNRAPKKHHHHTPPRKHNNNNAPNTPQSVPQKNVVVVEETKTSDDQTAVIGGECHMPPKQPKDRRKDKSKLTIVTYNPEWLFLHGGRGEHVRCPSPACPWKDAQQARKHLTDVAQVLDKLDADIINLQEVEDCGTLEELRKAMRDGDSYRVYMREGTDTALGQNVAMLTRIDPSIPVQRTEFRAQLPVPNSTCRVKKDGKSGVSKHYATEFEVEGLSAPLIFVGVHLMARPDDPHRCSQREGQAAVLVQLVKDLRQGQEDKHVIIAGDFNDYDARIEQLRRRHIQPDSSTLDILYRGLGMSNAIMASTRPPPEWFTLSVVDETTRHRKQVLIDHMMVSSSLFPLIADMEIVFEAKGVSDHLPLCMTIDLSKLTKPILK